VAKAWYGREGQDPTRRKDAEYQAAWAAEASIEGHPLRFGTKKSLVLLCYLASDGGRHSRRALAKLLWPQSDMRHARTDLRSALAKLRKTLGEDNASGYSTPHLCAFHSRHKDQRIPKTTTHSTTYPMIDA
jgi:hypothetical protein